MRIGVLGTGVVGQTLGTGLAARGHAVMLGTRDPSAQKVIEWKERTGAGAAVGTFDEAAAFGDLAVLATGWTGTEQALQLAGPDRLAGKVVIDVTNPLDFSTGAPQLALGHTDSGGEQVQRWLPEARVVKALNIIGAHHMIDPSFAEGAPDMFICGDDDGAKAEVTAILASIGWPGDHVFDIGGIEGARLLEPMCILWVVYAQRTGAWDHAFKMVRK